MSRIIGYARVSTEDQNLDMQKMAIEKYPQEQGLELIMYVEKISTRKTERTELQHALKAATKEDRFVVYKLDRLARSTKELYQLTDDMGQRGIDFVSIHDSFDTTTPTGRAMFGMLAVFAEFERDIIQKRGRLGGRPAIDADTKRRIVKLFESGESAADIAKEYGIRSSTIYKILKGND